MRPGLATGHGQRNQPVDGVFGLKLPCLTGKYLNLVKKRPVVLGAIFVFLVVLAVTLWGYENHLDSSSKDFVDTNMFSFFSTLSKDALVKMSPTNFQDYLNSDEFNDCILNFKKLGRFQAYEGSKGEAHMEFDYGIDYDKRNVRITANYLATANYQNGHGQVYLKLTKTGGRWQVDELCVYPPVFTN
jgi:hypothetical protein